MKGLVITLGGSEKDSGGYDYKSIGEALKEAIEAVKAGKLEKAGEAFCLAADLHTETGEEY